MSSPRIDTLRRDLNQTIHHIAQALQHLEDLHALATDRPRAAEQARVRGGQPDYALDTHGNPQARAAYEHLATQALRTTTALDQTITNALGIFDPGTITTRTDRTADATTTEIIAALATHQNRHQTGQPGSTPTVPQPLPRGAARALNATRLQQELDHLRSAVRKTRIRPDRAKLTPLELTAWQTATGTTPKKGKKRR